LASASGSNLTLQSNASASTYILLDTSGNVGIGVTPSVDTLGGKKFEIGFVGNGIQGYQVANLLMYNNATYNSGWKYANSASVAYYQQNGSQHIWYNAPSGTAGNAITFTQAMTLDASGNLGLGVTPSAWVSGYKVIQLGSTGAVYNVIGYTALANNIYYNGTNNIYLTTAAASDYYQFGGTHIWRTAPSGTAGNAITFTQAMTLDASGNLLVGQTSSIGSYKLQVNGIVYAGNAFYVLSQASGGGSIYEASGNTGIAIGDAVNVLRFTTSGSERARIDSNGYLLINLTSSSTSARLQVQYTTSTLGARFINASSTSSDAIDFVANSVEVGRINTSGTTTSYVTSSDYRLKNTVTPMIGALAKVEQLKPVTYKWNADGSDGEGFIAHELQEVCPQAVVGEKDAVGADGKPKYQGIDTSFLVATLTAAIQELSAQVTDLKAEIIALKAKVGA
jgi:hypothetical protein